MRVHILCRSETQSNISSIIALKRKKPDSFYLKFNEALCSNVAVCDQRTKSSLEREKNDLRLIYFPGIRKTTMGLGQNAQCADLDTTLLPLE